MSKSCETYTQGLHDGIGTFCNTDLPPTRRLGGVLDVVSLSPEGMIGTSDARSIVGELTWGLAHDPWHDIDQPGMYAAAHAAVAMALDARSPEPLEGYVDAFTRYGSTPGRILRITTESLVQSPKTPEETGDAIVDLARGAGTIFLSTKVLHSVTKALRRFR